MKTSNSRATLALASVVALFGMSASAADQWFVMGERVLNATQSRTEIKSEEGKVWKDDIKKAKISVEGADVEITNVVFHWRGGRDETITNVGVVRAGGQTVEKDAPGRESTLTSVDVQYKILGNQPNATIKVWGFD